MTKITLPPQEKPREDGNIVPWFEWGLTTLTLGCRKSDVLPIGDTVDEYVEEGSKDDSKNKDNCYK